MWHACVILLLLLLGTAMQGASTPETESAPTGEQEHIPETTPPRGMAPLRPILNYLRYYESQPARVLPYITERFRSGMDPRLWVDQTRALLAAQGYTRLAWTVHHLETTATEATVRVMTRARIDGQELLQQEIFTLVHTPEGEWLIDDWRLE